MVTAKTPENAKKYICELCSFKCRKLCDFKRHMSTAKHAKITNDAKMVTNDANNTPQIFQCICGKEYQYRSGLSRHKKACTNAPSPPPPHEENIQTTIEPIEPNSAELLVLVKELMTQMAVKNKHQDELMTQIAVKNKHQEELIAQMAAKDKHQDELIKQNMELQNTMREMIPHIGNNNSTTNTNSNNTFNVQLYLEKECKDAISLQDFIKNIEINISHLVAISKDGYVDSISKLLIQSLNKMAVTDRPLHCTDLKRETVYIKDMETWNKSTADAPIMNGLINSIENKYYAEVKQYVRDNPQARELDTPEYNFYAKACVHSLGNYEDHDKLNKKIYKKVLPEIKLDKTVAS
jgi:hypothetical protein